MATIRDESGVHLFGLDPVKALEWALRDWMAEELAEFHKL